MTHGSADAADKTAATAQTPRCPASHAVERTLSLLGESDDVTPFATGVALTDAWGIPSANVYRRRQGHFLLSLTLFPNDAPLMRLAGMLRDQALGRPSRLASAAL